MTVKLLTNSSPSAPSLTGAAGSLIAVLDYCLTNATYGAGWAKEFAGTNVAAYRAPTGNRMYLGVDDTTTNNARLRGFETMTAAGVSVASGSGPFPTDAQVSGGDYFYKSNDTGTARPWLFVSDGKPFYFSSSTGGTATTNGLMFFGEFESYKAGDAYNTLLAAPHTANNNTQLINLVTPATGTVSGHYLARAFTQLGGSTQCGKASDAVRANGGTALGGGGVTYPSPMDGGLLLGQVFITEPTGGIRGRLPGLWNPLHAKPLTEGDTFSGSGTLAGRNFLVRNIDSSYQCFLETSDTWYT